MAGAKTQLAWPVRKATNAACITIGRQVGLPRAVLDSKAEGRLEDGREVRTLESQHLFATSHSKRDLPPRIEVDPFMLSFFSFLPLPLEQ